MAIGDVVREFTRLACESSLGTNSLIYSALDNTCRMVVPGFPSHPLRNVAMFPTFLIHLVPSLIALIRGQLNGVDPPFLTAARKSMVSTVKTFGSFRRLSHIPLRTATTSPDGTVC